MKLYTVQYKANDTAKGGNQFDVAVWCASIAEATKAYNEHEKEGAVIKITSLPKGRDEMAKWLNERGVKV